MKNKTIQSPHLQCFRHAAKTKLSLITMQPEHRALCLRALQAVELPAREVAQLSKQEQYSLFCRRLVAAVTAELPAGSEIERILKEVRELLNM